MLRILDEISTNINIVNMSAKGVITRDALLLQYGNWNTDGMQSSGLLGDYMRKLHYCRLTRLYNTQLTCSSMNADPFGYSVIIKCMFVSNNVKLN